MADDPIFASTPAIGAALLTGSAETNLQVPTQTTTVFTAGANGSKIEEVVFVATTTSLAPALTSCCIYLFLYDGSTYHLFDAIAASGFTASATQFPWRTVTRYDNLVLKSGWSLRVSQSIAGNASILKCIAMGGDF